MRAEEDLGVRAGVLGVIGAEMRADVAEARGRQQRVDDRVRDGIAVGVPRQRRLARPFEAGEPERARRRRTRARRCRSRHAERPAAWSMRAIDGASGCCATSDSRTLEVGGCRDLERERVAVDDGHA